jgi:negative regulator of flagellin synthesis FlgM
MKVVNNSANPNAAANGVATSKGQSVANSAASTLQKSNTQKANEAVNNAGASKIDLSPRAQEMKKAKEVAMSAPDVDEAKVAKFRALIDSGNYKVDAKAVADKMVDESVKNAFFEAE